MLLLALPGAGVLADAPQGIQTSPILRLETGSHTAAVTSLAADAAGRYAATASLDKTVRVWDPSTGKAIAVFRPPIGDGDEGELLAVAVSPDGATIACGGETDYGGDGADVFLFDRATGKIVCRIHGPGGVVHALAYSRDGRYLAVGTDDDGGLSVYRAADGKIVGEDAARHGSVNSLQFTALDGDSAPVRLAVASTEGVYLYKFLETASTPLREVAHLDQGLRVVPGRLAFSPDGTRIAVGFADAAAVLILTGDDLTPKETYRVPDLDTVGDRGNLVNVCWSSDGHQVFASGDAGDKADESTIYRWTVGGKDSPVKMEAGGYQVMGLLCRPQGGLLFSAMSIPLGSFDADGRRSLFHAFPPARNTAEGDLLVAADGLDVALPSGTPGKSIRFSLRDQALRMEEATPAGLQAPVTARPGVAIQAGDAPDSPKLNGTDIPLDPAEDLQCKAIAPDEQSFVLATSHTLQCFNQDLGQIWSRVVPALPRKVNVDGDGKVVVAALDDGTIRWFRMRDGAELCTLYVDSDLTRWVVWTPAGSYNVSPGGEALFGWHLNHGKNEAAEFFPGAHYRDTRFRPQRVAVALEESPAVEATPPISPSTVPVITPPASISTAPGPAGAKPLTLGDAARILHRVDLQIALIRAVTGVDAAAVKRSLASGANPNDYVDTGPTLLSVAAAHGSTRIVALLLAAGADVNAREKNAVSHTGGMTPLMYIAITGNVAVAKLLLKAGADVNARSSEGKTPLTYAVESGADPAIVRLLRNAGGRR